MEEMWSVHASIQEVVSDVVERHRTTGILTWSLLHKIESEVLATVSSSGKHPKWVVDMMRAPEALGYPKDGRQVSFEGHDFIPPVFATIDDAWRRVN